MYDARFWRPLGACSRSARLRRSPIGTRRAGRFAFDDVRADHAARARARRHRASAESFPNHRRADRGTPPTLRTAPRSIAIRFASSRRGRVRFRWRGRLRPSRKGETTHRPAPDRTVRRGSPPPRVHVRERVGGVISFRRFARAGARIDPCKSPAGSIVDTSQSSSARIAAISRAYFQPGSSLSGQIRTRHPASGVQSVLAAA